MNTPLEYLADAAAHGYPDPAVADEEEYEVADERPGRLEPVAVLRRADELLNGTANRHEPEDIRQLAADIRDSLHHYGDLEGTLAGRKKPTPTEPMVTRTTYEAVLAKHQALLRQVRHVMLETHQGVLCSVAADKLLEMIGP